jgi:hypothetical protein
MVQMKGNAPAQGEIIAKSKNTLKFKKKKYSSPEPIRQFQSNFVQIILGGREFKTVRIKGPKGR